MAGEGKSEHMERNRIIFISIICGLIFSIGCTDAERSKLYSFGNSHSVKCYSGGVVIYDGIASGKVLSEENSDGYYFKDEKSGRLMEVSGNCVITRLD